MYRGVRGGDYPGLHSSLQGSGLEGLSPCSSWRRWPALPLLMFLFAYIVHTPHESAGRYVDTSTFVANGALGSIVTALWGFQNYHSIHHLFPRVPFYTYRSLFGQIEEVMIARGAPIYQLSFKGIQPYTGHVCCSSIRNGQMAQTGG